MWLLIFPILDSENFKNMYVLDDMPKYKGIII